MNARQPVDVVIPAYNAAAFLAEALESVAAQTVAPQHIFVIDDGSTDDTVAIARSFGATVISGPNRGLAEARNIGIRASRAPSIALLDADDRWYPERLECQLRVRSARPDVLLISSDYETWAGERTGNSSIAAHSPFTSVARESIASDAYVVSRDDVLRTIATRNFVLPSSMLLDRRLFDEYDTFFARRETFPENDATFVGEDLEWLLRVLRHTDVAFVDRILVDYRVRPTSLSARRGRIRNGDVVLGEIVAAHPERYAEGAAGLFAAAKPRMLLEAAVAHARVREFQLAADRLGDASLATAGPRAIAFSIANSVLRFRPAWPFLRAIVTLKRPSFLRRRFKTTGP